MSIKVEKDTKEIKGKRFYLIGLKPEDYDDDCWRDVSQFAEYLVEGDTREEAINNLKAYDPNLIHNARWVIDDDIMSVDDYEYTDDDIIYKWMCSS